MFILNSQINSTDSSEKEDGRADLIFALFDSAKQNDWPKVFEILRKGVSANSKSPFKDAHNYLLDWARHYNNFEAEQALIETHNATLSSQCSDLRYYNIFMGKYTPFPRLPFQSIENRDSSKQTGLKYLSIEAILDSDEDTDSSPQGALRRK